MNALAPSKRHRVGRALLASVALLAWSALAVSAVTMGKTGVSGQADAALLQRGQYLVRVGDCAACHTRAGGAPFAGGSEIPTPFGSIYAPNITPDKLTGIGAWSADDFRAAMHEGRAPDGRLLYPAFPFTSYTRVSSADVNAMYAWLRTLPPVHRRNTPPDLRFPYSLRKLLLGWRFLYFKPGRYQSNPRKSTQWNRGAYLVQGLGHCGECHTPRNTWGASRSDGRLAGGLIPLQDWYAPDLRAHDGGGLAGWSKRDIVDLLKTGRSARGTAFGPMADVVQQSLQHLTAADLEAMAEYLIDQPVPAKTPARGLVAPPLPQQAALLAMGQQIYTDHCAACHGRDGRGVDHVYPPLAGNNALLADDPVNAVRVVLLGGFEPTTQANPRPYSMPAYMQKLDDAQVAAVVTYLRQSWGNHAGAILPDSVRQYRTLPLR